MVNGGLFYDYKLGICPFKNQFDFVIQTMPANPEHKPERMFIPFRLLPLMRDKMAKMLAEFDGSEEIKPLPPIPKWITENGILKLGLGK